MTAFRDALLITLLIISALGAEQMTTQSIHDLPMQQQTFFYQTMAAEDFEKGRMDCHEGKPRKPNANDAYQCGYTHQEENHD